MSTSTDTVKVIVATLGNEGDHTKLIMTTTDKVRIEFELDDLAMSTLMITSQVAFLQGVKTRHESNVPTIFPRTDEVEL